MPDDAAVYAAHLDGIKSTLTVRENLEFWASVFGTGSIDAAIAVFDMDQLIDRPGGMLSAGQKRRLGLARLMVTGRPIWLLDEPTVSLDTVAVGQFGDMIAGHFFGMLEFENENVFSFPASPNKAIAWPPMSDHNKNNVNKAPRT